MRIPEPWIIEEGERHRREREEESRPRLELPVPPPRIPASPSKREDAPRGVIVLEF